MKSIEKLAPPCLVLVSIGFLLLFGYNATQRPLTNMEAYVFQIFALFLGLTGSYVFGRRATITGPHARSAFRRLASLYRSMGRVANIIAEEEREDDATKMKIIEVIVMEQITTVDDALADWQDIVPESVEELRQELARGTTQESGGRANG